MYHLCICKFQKEQQSLSYCTKVDGTTATIQLLPAIEKKLKPYHLYVQPIFQISSLELLYTELLLDLKLSPPACSAAILLSINAAAPNYLYPQWTSEAEISLRELEMASQDSTQEEDSSDEATPNGVLSRENTCMPSVLCSRDKPRDSFVTFSCGHSLILLRVRTFTTGSSLTRILPQCFNTSRL